MFVDNIRIKDNQTGGFKFLAAEFDEFKTYYIEKKQ